MATRTKKPKAARVGVIGKILRILELLDQFPAGLKLKDVAEKTGINKSTAHRFLSHLEAENYLLRDGGAFLLGPKIARLGGRVSSEATLCKISRPTLENLREITGETVILAVLDGSSVLYLDVLESPHRFRLTAQIGARGTAYPTALGKAILANMTDGEKKEEILAASSFEASTPRALTSIARVKKDLEQTREQGFSHDDEEAFAGSRCVGAAILGADGNVVAGISISGPTARVRRESLPVYSAQVRQAAQEISWNLGYRPPELDRAGKRRSVRKPAH
jgi:IclR family KDG regulon transcriptional repressor